MAEPCFAITGDDARFYSNPNRPGNLMSVTTVKKKGVPNPVMDNWLKKKVALRCIARITDIGYLIEVGHANK